MCVEFIYAGSAVAPSNVSATALSSSVISVQWSGLSPCRLVNGLIVKYRVQYGAQSGGLVESREVTGNWSTGAETELTGLTPSSNYSISVAAVNEEGSVGAYSDPVVVETLPGILLFHCLLYTLVTYPLKCEGHDQPQTMALQLRNSIIIGVTIAFFGIMMAASGILIACCLRTRSVFSFAY